MPNKSASPTPNCGGRFARRRSLARAAVDVGRENCGRNQMPTISMFYGVLIRMFFYDTDKHNVPHIHAEFQGQVAVYSIPQGELLAGSLPPNKHKMVVAWIAIHEDELMADWDLAVNGKKPFAIRGLDQ
ncbi:DUF4160 domain-containing protein [Thiohalocapsa sp. ML1]|uniref:DUF4160 domain-containing protein n=1 Tax=Thiohalocapsa sp. ML1 TaxID=1431688 RepID=UPI0020B1693B|nr:DUF4160 domain-containing protein [Thiohalocapsa sp. ML1]